jgi:hypothetical protein
MTPILDASLRAAFPTRLMVAAGLLAAPGLLMGLPFRMGIRQAEPQMVPFLWEVNGFFSVVGSVTTVILSINFGFRWVLMVATVAHLAA